MKDARDIELVEGDRVIRLNSFVGPTEGVYLREDDTREECGIMLNLKTQRENVCYKRETYKVPKK